MLRHGDWDRQIKTKTQIIKCNTLRNTKKLDVMTPAVIVQEFKIE
jgi:hypothetical protein